MGHAMGGCEQPAEPCSGCTRDFIAGGARQLRQEDKAGGSELKLGGVRGQPCKGRGPGLPPLMLHPDGGSGGPGGLPRPGAGTGLAAGVPLLVARVAVAWGQAAEAAPQWPRVVGQEGSHAGELGVGVLPSGERGRGEPSTQAVPTHP